MDQIHSYVKFFYENTQISQIANLLVKIAKKYPFTQTQIINTLINTFPHHASTVE